MDIRQLFDHSLSIPLDAEERKVLHAYLEAYPYCSVLYFIQARARGDDANYRELASVYARDRSRLNAYLAAGQASTSSSSGPSAAEVLSSTKEEFDQFAPIISWRLDTFINIWIERTRDRANDVLSALGPTKPAAADTTVPISEEHQTPASKLGSSSNISSWIQEIAQNVRQEALNASAPVGEEPASPADTSAKLVTQTGEESTVSPQNPVEIVSGSGREVAVPLSAVDGLPVDSTTSDMSPSERGQEKSPSDASVPPNEEDELLPDENWRERIPDFVELDVKPTEEKGHGPALSAETSLEGIDPKALQLENDIKARIRRAKDLLRRSSTESPIPRPLKEQLTGPASATESPQKNLEELRSNIRLIREATLAQTSGASPSPQDQSKELKSDYEPTRFLDRFITPEFDPKSHTLSAYRLFSSQGEVPELKTGEPVMKTSSFSRFVEPNFDGKADTLRIPPRLPEPVPIEQLSEAKGFVPDPKGTLAQSPPIEAPEPENLPAAEAAPASLNQPASDSTQSLRTESFARFVEPVFDKKVKTTAESIPLSDVASSLKADESRMPSLDSESSVSEVSELHEALTSKELPEQAIAEKTTTGPIEPVRSESFSRFVEPEFTTTPPTLKASEPAQKQMPEPEKPAEKTTTGPIEPVRSESFSRFVEPEFTTTPPTLKASEPAQEHEPQSPATPEPAAESLAEVLGKGKEPEPVVPEPKPEPAKAAPPTLDLEKLQRIASEVARSAEEKMRAEELGRKAEARATQPDEEVSPVIPLEIGIQSETLDLMPAEPTVSDQPSREAALSEEEPIETDTLEPVLAETPVSTPQTRDVSLAPAEPFTAVETGALESTDSTILVYPHGDLTVEIRLKPDQLKYFRTLDRPAASVSPVSRPPDIPFEEGTEPIVSPELIKRRFEEQQRSQSGGSSSGTLEKVIIDYARQTIEFVVEPAATETESPVEVEPAAAPTETIPIDVPAAPPAALAPPSYEPADIRRQVPDYSEFLYKALSFKESYTESEARTFLKLIYNRTELQSSDFLEQTFDLPRILPIAPSPESTAEDLRTSRELMAKLSSLDVLYAEEEASGTTAKEVSAEDAEDLEHTSNEIDSRIDRFRSNLQRIRTKSGPSEANLSQIQDRYLSSVLAAMLEEFEEEAPQASRPEPESTYSLEDVPHTNPADSTVSGSVDHVLLTYGTFEPILQAQIDRLRTREPELADLDDFSIENEEETDDELPPSVITESMARLLAQQGNARQAERIYRSLQLKYPEKSDYFAAEIERLIGKQNE